LALKGISDDIIITDFAALSILFETGI